MNTDEHMQKIHRLLKESEAKVVEASAVLDIVMSSRALMAHENQLYQIRCLLTTPGIRIARRDLEYLAKQLNIPLTIQ